MKEQIATLVSGALQHLLDNNIYAFELPSAVQVTRTKDPSHGDFSTNIALQLAKQANTNPRQMAEKIVDFLPQADNIAKVTIAGPGFINFTLEQQSIYAIIPQILQAGAEYGRTQVENAQKIILEYVSCNPTGPLHVGHGRGAAYGSTLANAVKAIGHEVHREYYVNDAGRQMDILAVSVWLRYLELLNEKPTFPENAYQGDYIIDIATTLKNEFNEQFKQDATLIPALDECKEKHIDAIIAYAKEILGSDNYAIIHRTTLDAIIRDIKQDLVEFNVEFDEWFSEKSLTDSGAIEDAITRLQKQNQTYEKDGALWFKSTDFGDDKDRVLKRDNGSTTYFASDVAYHMNKFDRGFDRVIDIFGADHHGYIKRVSASIDAMGGNSDHFKVLLVQFATLYRGKEKVQMSTRSGSFITLRALREEVGNDAARFFYVLRKGDQHMDFDLELAKSQSSDNPIYYIQYAHARICSVFRQAPSPTGNLDKADLTLLTLDHEKALVKTITRYPEVVLAAGSNYEPHLIAHYLRELAGDFHTYYNAHQFLVDDEALCHARLCLIGAVKQVLLNGLSLLGVGAPEQM